MISFESEQIVKKFKEMYKGLVKVEYLQELAKKYHGLENIAEDEDFESDWWYRDEFEFAESKLYDMIEELENK